MKSTVLEKIKQNNVIYEVYFWIRYYIPQTFCFIYLFLFRKYNRKYHFNEIQKYAHIHDGKRCFIVATAPSLDLEQLQQIKGEYAIGVNSLVTVFDRTDWRPTYYGVQDSGVERVKEQILKYRKEFKEFFVGISPVKKLVPHFGCDEVNYLFYLLDHSRRGTKHIFKTTDQADKYLYDGFSITFSMIELAMYMGFTEIVLLGVDCDYSGDKAHFDEYTDARVPDAAANMYQAYCQMRDYAEQKGVHIVNASKGFKLKAFECRELENILKKTY